MSIVFTPYTVPASIQYPILAVARLFSLQISWAHLVSYSVYRVLLPRRVKLPEPEAGHLLPLIVQVRTLYSYTSNPQYTLMARCPVTHTWTTATLPWILQSETEVVACR